MSSDSRFALQTVNVEKYNRQVGGPPPSTKIFNVTSEELLDYGWRYTIGRISCAARIPIYAFAASLQTGKIVIKGVVSLFVSLGRELTGSKKFESWSISGVAKDAIQLGSLFDRILNSAICAILAPPREYHSFGEALKGSASVVIGKYHNVKTATVYDFFLKATLFRPQYHKLLWQLGFSDKRIYLSDLSNRENPLQAKNGVSIVPTTELLGKIKAG